MATPLGTGVLTSLSRHIILPEVIDATYDSNPLTFRLLRMNKRTKQGGTQIEVPVLYRKSTTGGPWGGYDVLDVSPQDNVKSMAWDWKGQYGAVTIDEFTLVKMDSPQKALDTLRFLFEEVKENIADKMGVGFWSDGTVAKQIDGLEAAVDDGGVAPTYAGLLRSANTWMNSTDDAATATLDIAPLQTFFGNVKQAGRAPTSFWSRQEQINRYLNLGDAAQRFPVGAAGHDQQLYSAGFTDALFNNVPWIEDSHCFDGPNSTNSAIVALVEDYIEVVVTTRADMVMKPFQQPTDQFAYTSLVGWIGNLIHKNPARSGKMSAVAA